MNILDLLYGTAPAPTRVSLDPFSATALQMRGYYLIGGKTAEKDLVMFAPGSYCTIPNAIRNGLITETSIPFNLQGTQP